MDFLLFSCSFFSCFFFFLFLISKSLPMDLFYSVTACSLWTQSDLYCLVTHYYAVFPSLTQSLQLPFFFAFFFSFSALFGKSKIFLWILIVRLRFKELVVAMPSPPRRRNEPCPKISSTHPEDHEEPLCAMASDWNWLSLMVTKSQSHIQE